jgi:NAD(P)-dependent dehydrogenase (short-subunit alcohol dehydrogenase family)
MTIDIQYDFSGHIAIVTGGARGIGRAVATQLVRFGARVWIWDIARKTRAQRRCNGFADRCSDETTYSTGTESVARALEVLVNQYDWLRGPLTVRVVKRLKFSAVGIVGITLG